MSFDERERSAHGGQPVELYSFACGSSIWRWTSADRPQAYGGHTYAPETIRRGQIDQNGEDEQGELELTVPRTNPVAELFIADLPVRPVTLTAYRLHRSEPEVVCFFIGEVASAEFTGSTVKLTCLPESQILRRQIPTTTFQAQCNWALFSGPCGLNKDDFRVAGTVSAIAGLTIQAAAFAALPSGYLTSGWVEIPGGEIHWITAHSGSTVTLLTPFRDIAIGDTVHAFPGCDRSIAACKAFDNLEHFFGFPWVPTKNPFITGIG